MFIISLSADANRPKYLHVSLCVWLSLTSETVSAESLNLT